MDLRIVEGDLLDQDVDVIVNAWNRNIIPWWLLLPQGVSGAIKRRGGKDPFRELGTHGPRVARQDSCRVALATRGRNSRAVTTKTSCRDNLIRIRNAF
ncbi:MAG: hypothetical protein QM811_15285 [Pirellulales bacterium]